MDIAYLVTSHNRITQTKAQIELVKNLYSQSSFLSNIDIFHAYNGDPKEYSQPHLGEKIIRRDNLGHFRGACDLINSGITQILSENKEYKYIIVASGDVWFVNPKLIETTIKYMDSNNKLLCTSIWFLSAYATEFFIIERTLAEKVFPLDLIEYEKDHPIEYFLSKFDFFYKLAKYPILEILFRKKVKMNANLKKDVIFFDKMKYIFYNTRWIRKRVKYYSPHSISQVKKVIIDEHLTRYGDMFEKLLYSSN